MKTHRISKWIRTNGLNLEIGNFGNDGIISKSLSCKVDGEIPGSVIVRDDIEGNLILNDLTVGANIKILGEVRGLVQANDLEAGGFTYIHKDNLEAEFVARNSKMRGIFFFKGNEPFWSVDLSNSEFEYLFFNELVNELVLNGTTVEELIKLPRALLDSEYSIKKDSQTYLEEVNYFKR